MYDASILRHNHPLGQQKKKGDQRPANSMHLVDELEGQWKFWEICDLLSTSIKSEIRVISVAVKHNRLQLPAKINERVGGNTAWN